MYQTMGNMKVRGGEVVGSRRPVENAIRRSRNRPVERYTQPIETYTPIPGATKQKSATKSLWGRPLWFSLHYGAYHYPANPDNRMIDMNVGFIRGLPIMIPCDMCKNHAYDYISNFTDAQLRSISSDKEKLFTWYWEFHNSVNERTGKPTITLQDAIRLYETSPSDAL